MQKVREQLAARWDVNKKETTVNIDNIKSLSETMSVEKIAAIKAKRLANKRTTIKRTDNEDAMATDLRAILDYDVDSTKHIISRERQWRTRTTILQSAGKMFAKNIFAILQGIKAREEGRNRPAAQQAIKMPEPARIAKPQPQLTQYNRYDQERFNRQKEGKLLYVCIYICMYTFWFALKLKFFFLINIFQKRRASKSTHWVLIMVCH